MSDNAPDTQSAGFVAKLWKTTTEWLKTDSGLALHLREFDGPTLLAALDHTCRAQGFATGDPDMDQVDQDFLRILNHLTTAEAAANRHTHDQRVAAVGQKGAQQQDADMAAIREEMANLIKGLSGPQAIGAYFLVMVSQALEFIPAVFSADKSLVARSLGLAADNAGSSYGQFFHSGGSLRQFANILLPQRILTGLPGRVDVLAAVIDEKFATNLKAYLPSNFVPTFILMLGFYGVPLTSTMSRNRNLKTAVETFQGAAQLGTVLTDMSEVATNLKSAARLMDEVLEKTKIGKVGEVGFKRVVTAIKKGDQAFDLPKALGVKLERAQLTYAKRVWKTIIDTSKKGVLGANWLALIGGLIIATIGSGQQATIQGLVVLGAMVQIFTYLIDTTSDVNTLARLVVLAAGPSIAQYTSVALPLAFFRKNLTEYIDGKSLFDRSEAIRWAAAAWGLIQLWTFVPLVPGALTSLVRILSRCIHRNPEPTTTRDTLSVPGGGVLERTQADADIEDALVEFLHNTAPADIDTQRPVDDAVVSQTDGRVFDYGPLEGHNGPVGFEEAFSALRLLETRWANSVETEGSPQTQEDFKSAMDEASKRMDQLDFRGHVHKLTRENMANAGLHQGSIDDVINFFMTGKGEMKKTVERFDLDTASLRADPRFSGANMDNVVYTMEDGVVVFRQITIHYWRFTNSALSHIGSPTTTCGLELFHSTTSEDYGAFIQDGWLPQYENMLHQGQYDNLSDDLTDPILIHKASTGYWERRDHRTKDVKVVRMMPVELCVNDPRYNLPTENITANFDYRHADLAGAIFNDNDTVSHGLGGVKCLTSQPMNLNRQASVIHVFHLLTGELKGIVAGSKASSLRTGEIWNEAVFLAQPQPGWIGYNVGAGPIGQMWPHTINAAPELPRPGHLIVQSTGNSAFTLAEAWNAQEEPPFPVKAVAPLVMGQGRANKAFLKGVKFVGAITANPTEEALFTVQDIDWDINPVLIDLSIKMFEDPIVAKFIENGWPIVFDDFDNSMHRNVQTATIHLTTLGLTTLEAVKDYNIHNLSDVKRNKMFFKNTPLMIVSSGCASFDVHQANAILEECEEWRSGNWSE